VNVQAGLCRETPGRHGAGAGEDPFKRAIAFQAAHSVRQAAGVLMVEYPSPTLGTESVKIEAYEALERYSSTASIGT